MRRLSMHLQGWRNCQYQNFWQYIFHTFISFVLVYRTFLNFSSNKVAYLFFVIYMFIFHSCMQSFNYKMLNKVILSFKLCFIYLPLFCYFLNSFLKIICLCYYKSILTNVFFQYYSFDTVFPIACRFVFHNENLVNQLSFQYVLECFLTCLNFLMCYKESL